MSRILQTHLIRLDDGHCMTDWIDISEKTDMEIFHLKQDIKYGELKLLKKSVHREQFLIITS